MTNREKEILDMIRKNPMLSQKELSEALGITRSSVAVHITNLTKKGLISGKGYILNENDYVTIIGGANIDIQGFPNDRLILKDSNPGKVKISLGGVGRNIAENLTKLGVRTKLITALGDDMYGKRLLDECKLSSIDMNDSFILKGNPTSIYLSILDGKGDMKLAISHMDIFDGMTIELIKEKLHIIKSSRLIILDTNIPRDTIEYMVTNYKDIDFFLDTVSTTKAKKVKDIIGNFHTIKPNKLEAEILTGITIQNKDDLRRVAYDLLNKGVKRVFISLGGDGVYYQDESASKIISTPKVNVMNATGAGDAFIAGLAYAYLNEYSIEKSAVLAIAASILALSHENTINPSMSVENIKRKMKELRLC